MNIEDVNINELVYDSNKPNCVKVRAQNIHDIIGRHVSDCGIKHLRNTIICKDHLSKNMYENCKSCSSEIGCELRNKHALILRNSLQSFLEENGLIMSFPEILKGMLEVCFRQIEKEINNL